MVHSSARRISLSAWSGALAATFLSCALPRAQARLPEVDVWDVVQVNGQRMGHAHTTLRLVEESGREVARVRQVTQISMARYGQETRMEVDYSDRETPDGALLDFELVMKQGTTPMRTTGKVVGDRLELQIESQNQKQSHRVAWTPGAGGLLGAELSLLARPLKPGEHRTVAHLDMDNQISTSELSAKEEEPVTLPGGQFRLLKIDMLDRMAAGADGRRMEIGGAVWTNASGEVLKDWIKPLNMETFRVTREAALAKSPLARLDLGEATLVKVDRAIPHAHDARWVRYRVHIDDGDPVAAFAAGPAQAIKRIDAHTAELTVRAVRPMSGKSTPAEKSAATDLPTDADRQPNNFIQSDDPLIVAQAKEAAGDETDPWKVAVALESYVYRAVTAKDFSQALATASEVARNHEGDCKGHAVYLAALARARKIPARVAVGLVYMPQAQAFGYHMWTEVYADGRWIGLDGTLAKGGLGGGHLELAHSPLAGAVAYNSFLPVMLVVGRLKVEVLGWE